MAQNIQSFCSTISRLGVRVCHGLLAVLLLTLVTATTVQAHTPLPVFSKAFSPSTIGPGSVSTLVFTIDNTASTAGARSLDFTDNLPAGVTIASPAATSSTCTGGIITAPDGGSTITYSGGGVGGGRTCVVRVNVTSSTVGTHTNVSGDLTSDAGNSGPATADLVVATDRPGFTKAFSPSTVVFGGRSTLTFTIDNSANTSALSQLSFTDTMPTGMVVASPANASTTCGSTSSPATLTATPGSSVISLAAFGSSFPGFEVLLAGATCIVKVDVIGGAVGTLGNTSGELTSDPGPKSSGKAGAVLTVSALATNIFLDKTFTNDPVAPGGTVNLRFTIFNRDRNFPANDIAFSDDLDAVVSGLVATGLPISACGGTLSSTDGGSTIDFTGGSLALGGSCTINVTVEVPALAVPDTYTNTTTNITAELGGDTVTGNAATDQLFIEPRPALTKTFLDDPVGSGGTTTLEFTITNTSPTSSATDIAFEDVFNEVLPTASLVPLDGSCGTGSDFTFTPLIDSPFGSTPARLVLSGGELAAGESCTFSITLDVSPSAATATYTNTTSAITAVIDGETYTGDPASDDLAVVAAPRLTKLFTDDPVAPGGTVTLEFTLTHNENAPGDATDIAFTDDLSAMTAGLEATGLPATDVCGIGSEISGTTNLSFTGGTLAPGESCTFSVSIDVDATAVSGVYNNLTSDVSATVLGVTASETPAEDELVISALTLTKEFTDDPVAPGGTVTLAFTLTNDDPTNDATSITFTDNLDDVLEDLVATGGVPAGVCGGNLFGAAGNSLLLFTGGTVPAGESCTFSVTLEVPSDAFEDDYPNLTSEVTALLGGEEIKSPPARDLLTVGVPVNELTLSKAFTNDPVTAGATVNLRFRVSFLGSVNATGIAFTDDLSAVLPGLVATGLPTSVCGGTLSGTGTLAFTGGSLAPGGSCTFNVTLQVPAGAADGFYPNTTSTITGIVGTNAVTGAAATDVLRIVNRLLLPVADAGEDQTVECAYADGAGTPVTLDGSASNDPDGGPLTYSWTKPGEEGEDEFSKEVSPTLNLPVGTHTITLTVTDDEGDTASDTVVITIQDTLPPVITLGGDAALTLECGIDAYVELGATAVDACDGPLPNPSPVGTVVDAPGTYTITYSATDDAGLTGTATRTVTVEDTTAPVVTLNGGDQTLECNVNPYVELGATADDACDGPLTVTTTGSVDTSAPGTYTVTYSATDGAGLSDEKTRTVEVEDTLPPTITTEEGPIELWPPNHDYYSFATTDFVASVSDVCDLGLSVADVILTSVSSDEPEDATGGGDGNTLDDIVIAGGCQAVDLRSERQGSGNGRVYTSNLEVTDASGNSDDDAFQVIVPKSKKKGAVDDGPVYVVIGECDDPFTEERKIGSLRLATFNARVDAQQTVLLDWRAAPGTVADGPFEVEYRPAEIEDFRVIGQGTDTYTHGGASLAPGTHYYRLKQTDAEGRTLHSDEVEVFIELPGDFALSAVYPNPFNPEARFTLMVKAEEQVQIKVFSILGRHVATLHSGTLTPQQNHTFVLDGSDLPSGTYLIRAIGETFTATRQVVLLK